MSLLSEAMSDCVIINALKVNDGYGSVTTVYQEGANIRAAIVLNNSTQARIAEKLGVTALYTVTTEKDINLQYHDIIKRLEDGKIFRVTSDGDDLKTPDSAALNMRNVSAEEWTLPAGGNDAQ